MKKTTSKIKPMKAPAPRAPPTIAPVFDRFKATGALVVVLLDMPAGIKEVYTTSCVDVESEEPEVTRDVDWNRLNQ